MKIIKSLFTFGTLVLILNNCASLSEAGDVLRNEKKVSNNEFLIKKKQPLTQPPDFNTVPKPGSFENKAEKSKNTFQEKLKNVKSESPSSRKKSSSTENSILNQIKK